MTDQDKTFTTIELPEKTYFKIGEVAKFLEVEPYVLRYWETEFDVLSPEKTKSGQRVYQRSDIELLFQIRALLYEEMFTIAGACRQLNRSREGKPNYFDLRQGISSGSGTAVADDHELRQQLETARRELTTAQTELQDVRTNHEELRLDASQLQDELAQARQEAVVAQDALEDARGQIAEISAQRDEAVKRWNQSKATGSDGQDEAELRALREQIVALQQKLERVQADSERRETELRRAIADRRVARRKKLNSLRHQVEVLSEVALVGVPSRS